MRLGFIFTIDMAVTSSTPPGGTLANQDKLPKLPIPPLEDTLKRYLKALEGLQDPKDHASTKKVVDEFLNGDGPRIQARLNTWAQNKPRYVELPNPLRSTVYLNSFPSYIEDFWWVPCPCVSPIYS